MAPNLRPANGGLWDEYTTGPERKRKRMALDLVEVARGFAPVAPAGSFQRYRQMRDIKRTPDEMGAINLAREKRGFQSPMETNSQFRAIEAALPPDLQQQRAEAMAKRDAAPYITKDARLQTQMSQIEADKAGAWKEQQEYDRKLKVEAEKKATELHNVTISNLNQDLVNKKEELKTYKMERDANKHKMTPDEERSYSMNTKLGETYLAKGLELAQTQGMESPDVQGLIQKGQHHFQLAENTVRLDAQTPQSNGGAPQLPSGSQNQAPQLGYQSPQSQYIAPQLQYQSPQSQYQSPQSQYQSPQVSSGMLNPQNMERSVNNSMVAKQYVGLDDKFAGNVYSIQTFGVEPEKLAAVEDTVSKIEQILPTMNPMQREIFIRDILGDEGIQNLIQGESIDAQGWLIGGGGKSKRKDNRRRLDALTERLRALFPGTY